MVLEIPISDANVLALGRATVYFSLLESNLRMLVGVLISLSNEQSEARVGRIVTAQLGFRALSDLTASLIHYRSQDENQIKTLLDILDRADKATKSRNDMIHSIWAVGEDKDSVTRMKDKATSRKKGYEFEAVPMTTSDIEAVATEIAEAALAVETFYIGLHTP